jgi:hypothetical protein
MILHAIEELYFFGKYEESRKVAEDILTGMLNGDLRQIILDYKERCEAKFGGLQGEVERPKIDHATKSLTKCTSKEVQEV